MLKGAALVIPGGRLRTRAAEPIATSAFCEDPAAYVVVELAAMDAAVAHERSLGHTPIDVPAQKKGWDIESRDSAGGPLRLIEVGVAASDLVLSAGDDALKRAPRGFETVDARPA